jgi:D-3-phosphoglycerate dehydrogenase / 2-oxoglutarate reductase
MKITAAITIFDIGNDFAREIAELGQLGVAARFITLEGTDDPDVIVAALKGYTIILAGSELLGRQVLAALHPELKMIARLGTGVDRVDIPAATELGILVTNAPGANACSVAQHALAMMMDLAAGITRYDAAMRAGVELRRTMADDIIGKTVGLVGFGNIPRILAELLQGFHCEILAYDVFRQETVAARLGVRYTELDELLARSDFVSLHLPLTPETQGTVNRDFFRKMKRSAFFINTSRGHIVKEDDLIAALENNIIAGAGLDVYETSPLRSDSPLLKLRNTVLTPYVAFSSKLGNRRTMIMAIDSIADYLAGKPIRNLLNPAAAR